MFQNNPSTKHHFLPIFYLSRWTDTKNEVVQWSRPHLNIIPKACSPEATGFEIDLYATEGLSPELRQWFEDVFFKDADDQAAKALDRIIRGEAQSLNLKERSAWSRFVMTLQFRHPDVIPELRASVERVWEQEDAFTEEGYRRRRLPTDPATFAEWLTTISFDYNARAKVAVLQAALDNKQLGAHINGMAWDVFDVSKSIYPLLTSDWPVDIYLAEPARSLICLPISPTKIFIASDSDEYLRHVKRHDPTQFAKIKNRIVVEKARRYVYSTDKKQQGLIRKRFSTLMQPTPFFPRLSKLGLAA